MNTNLKTDDEGILSDEAMENLLGEDFSTAYSGHVAEYRVISKAQKAITRKDTIKEIKQLISDEGISVEVLLALKAAAKEEEMLLKDMKYAKHKVSQVWGVPHLVISWETWNKLASLEVE